jgi:hypothetical protein
VGVTMKTLGSGQLSGTGVITLLTGVADYWVPQQLIFVNTHSAAVTLDVWYKPSGGTARRIHTKNASLAAGEKVVLVGPFPLAVGDIIEAQASVANVMDWVAPGWDYT